MRYELTTVNIFGKRSRIGVMTIPVGLYDVHGLVRMFGWGPN